MNNLHKAWNKGKHGCYFWKGN